MFLSSRLTHTPPSAFAGALLWHLSAPGGGGVPGKLPYPAAALI